MKHNTSILRTKHRNIFDVDTDTSNVRVGPGDLMTGKASFIKL